MWLLIPNMAKFSQVMSAYRKGTSADDLVELNGMYFDNRDLQLLLNLLWQDRVKIGFESWTKYRLSLRSTIDYLQESN